MLHSELPACDVRTLGMIRPLLPVCLLLAIAAAPQGQSRPPAAETARQLQQKYDQVKDFTADFTHTYEGGVLKKKSTERGTVQIVADGRMIYSYVPADKQVIRSPMPADDEATTAVLFLAGKGNLTRDFNVSYVEGGSDDTWSLRLDPKQKQKDYDWLILVVDRKALQIRGLTAADQQGGRSTFQFTNYRENTGLPENAFVFKIPRGTDVITAGDRR
jgi:outer membrane lipoprotein-sorting protein